ncbi:MAG: hypothetical protein JST84_18910 [Acidobacteria bacterium]|nr:hypothetical protein [Acidobacteriota bacterium]
MSNRRLMYIELKSGYGDSGPAWISHVTFSKSGRTVYFNGKALKRNERGGISGNYYDLESGDEYWVSGVKKRGTNRHWAGSGKIQLDVNAVTDFLQHTGQAEVDSKQYEICSNIKATAPKDFFEMENEKHISQDEWPEEE